MASLQLAIIMNTVANVNVSCGKLWERALTSLRVVVELAI